MITNITESRVRVNKAIGQLEMHKLMLDICGSGSSREGQATSSAIAACINILNQTDEHLITGYLRDLSEAKEEAIINHYAQVLGPKD